jgi:predicted nucleic acid-binding protein
MLATVSNWHEHHEQAIRELESRLAAGETMVVAGPALVEAYSVLTRIPPPQRLPPARALSLIEANFDGPDVETVSLSPAEYRLLLRQGPEQGVAGGRIYDAVIVACGLSAGVDVLLTFNERHFRALAAEKIRVVVPR